MPLNRGAADLALVQGDGIDGFLNQLRQLGMRRQGGVPSTALAPPPIASPPRLTGGPDNTAPVSGQPVGVMPFKEAPSPAPPAEPSPPPPTQPPAATPPPAPKPATTPATTGGGQPQVKFGGKEEDFPAASPPGNKTTGPGIKVSIPQGGTTPPPAAPPPGDRTTPFAAPGFAAPGQAITLADGGQIIMPPSGALNQQEFDVLSGVRAGNPVGGPFAAQILNDLIARGILQPGSNTALYNFGSGGSPSVTLPQGGGTPAVTMPQGGGGSPVFTLPR